MSISDTRQALATALSTVDGVNGHLWQPKSPKSGDAWGNVSVLNRAEGASFDVTWRVAVIAPTDPAAASVFLESKLYDLFDALEPVGFIDSFEPVQITVESLGSMNAILITLRAED